MKKRILFVGHSPNMAGAEYSLLRLIKEVHQTFDLEVLAPSGGIFEEEVKRLGLTFYDLKINYAFCLKTNQQSQIPQFTHTLCSQVESLIQKIQKPDLIHTNTFFMFEGVCLAASWNIPHVWNLREIIMDSPTWKPIWSWGEMFRKMTVMSDRFIAVSSALKRALPEDIQEQTNVVVNGLDNVNVMEKAKARQVFKEKWAIEDDTPVLLTIGNFIPEKGHDFLIPVVEDLAEKIPEAVFLWVGNHQLTHIDIEKKLRDKNLISKVIMPGHVDHMGKMLSGADLLLLSSSTEACPTTVLEAKRAGVPVVARDCGGAKELLEYGGGKTVGLDDVQSFSQCVIDFVNNPGSVPVSKEDPFTMKEMACKYVDIYNDVISRRVDRSKARRQEYEALKALSEDLDEVRLLQDREKSLNRSRLKRYANKLFKKLF